MGVSARYGSAAPWTVSGIAILCLAACATGSVEHGSGNAADQAAKDFISALGPQETFARLGWQQNPGYPPAEECFAYWENEAGTDLSPAQIEDCASHAADLARLYASYGTVVDPIVFTSRYFWSESFAFNTIEFPKRVAAWKASGGNEDDASFLSHPVCAKPLQEGWTGSDYFYDGREHPLCRLYKLEAREAG